MTAIDFRTDPVTARRYRVVSLVGYLHEMTVFPKGKHDDQVDSTAQFLDWSKTPMPT